MHDITLTAHSEPSAAQPSAIEQPATGLVEAFLAASTAWEQDRGRGDLHAALQHAARALVRAAADRHHVEEASRVYLVLTPQGWAVDGPTFDGYPLEGYDEGPVATECEHGDELDEECAAVREAAERISLPTAEELLALLRDSR